MKTGSSLLLSSSQRGKMPLLTLFSEAGAQIHLSISSSLTKPKVNLQRVLSRIHKNFLLMSGLELAMYATAWSERRTEVTISTWFATKSRVRTVMTKHPISLKIVKTSSRPLQWFRVQLMVWKSVQSLQLGWRLSTKRDLSRALHLESMLAPVASKLAKRVGYQTQMLLKRLFVYLRAKISPKFVPSLHSPSLSSKWALMRQSFTSKRRMWILVAQTSSTLASLPGLSQSKRSRSAREHHAGIRQKWPGLLIKVTTSQKCWALWRLALRQILTTIRSWILAQASSHWLNTQSKRKMAYSMYLGKRFITLTTSSQKTQRRRKCLWVSTKDPYMTGSCHASRIPRRLSQKQLSHSRIARPPGLILKHNSTASTYR